jgi:hypothetical protein
MISRLDAYQKGYKLGVCSGAQLERAQLSRDDEQQMQTRKARSRKSSKNFGKRLVAGRAESYKSGVCYGVRKARIQKSKVINTDLLFAALSKQDQQDSDRQVVSSGAETFNSTVGIARYRLRGKSSVTRQAPCFEAVPQDASDICEFPTPARAWAKKLVTGVDASTLQKDFTCVVGKRITGKKSADQVLCERTLIPESATTTKSHSTVKAPSPGMEESHHVGTPVPAEVTQSTGTESLCGFLRNPVGATCDPAAFQLRCKQFRQDKSMHLSKKVVLIVSGKCSLWKLNQIIAECFTVGEQDFVHESKKGETVLGSHFLVSRPIHPGRCSNVMICSSSSASASGCPSFLPDQSYTVAQLFRGRSTRYALEREPGEAAQSVTYVSPLLSAGVEISLDGIMLDSYDSGNLFDKQRRLCNGQRPLPRIVRSSFLNVAEIESKNMVMRGSRQGPDFLLKFDESWSAIHASSRRSQRKPLFRKDGRDFDLCDSCYVHGDEETDTDVD